MIIVKMIVSLMFLQMMNGFMYKITYVASSVVFIFTNLTLKLLGQVTSTGRFFLSLFVVSSHEDCPSILKIFNFIKEQGVTPKKIMGDYAEATTNAIKECWGDEPVRLMCWAHTTRAVDRSDYLKAMRAADSDFTQKLLNDLDLLQWMVTNENTFRSVFLLFKDKYTTLAENKVECPELISAVGQFFNYMQSVWVDKPQFRWYEGANPWGPGHNQSIEGTNKGIKENYTFRHKLELGELFR